MTDSKPIDLLEAGTRAPAAATKKGNGKTEPLPKLVPMSFAKGEIIPPRQWIVPHWIPDGTITLIQGNGGDGKTPLVQQLLTGCAASISWIGQPVKGCTTLGFFTEDTERDLKERQASINTIYDLEVASSKMHLFPRLGLENELVVFDGSGKPQLTPFFHQIREAALDYRAGLIVLDVLVDLFGGDEIRRRQVRAFLRPLLGLGAELPTAIVLTSHVSQAGIQSGGGHSGSTDWSNASRSRLYLTQQGLTPMCACLPARKQTSPPLATRLSCAGKTASWSLKACRASSAGRSKPFSWRCSTR
jgi:archaellum biogenesis ATPase FlaH